MVHICLEIYNDILLNTPSLPPESGGILGGQNGTITDYFRDMGIQSDRMDHYQPSIITLNKQLRTWHNQDIQFCGIYHTHYEGDTQLSGGDIKYVKRILIQLQHYSDSLLFPLVFPKHEIIFYKAKLRNGKVSIFKEKVIFINKEVYYGK